MRTITLALAATFMAATAAHADQVWVTMDQVAPYEFKQEVDQIVIGNPGIADITVRDKSKVLIFGKAPGVTNLFLFDDEGKPVDNLIVRVRATGSEMLTFHRGGTRATYNCMTQCEPTITVGDNNESFGVLTQQVLQKSRQATAGGETNE
ncbi:MAG: pilus assembly protein N-terminal domain-containing protein [Parvularculaceae bacterium]|nr:pilus assembly protein N-terminal domain-containing protein [Parvularculaceae bacterium]